ncbi:Sialin, partial [Stegodyphus mimosarum]
MKKAEGNIQEKYEPGPCCYLPARYVLTLLLFWAMSLEFAHRVCMSVTIVAMVNHTTFIQGNDSQVEDKSCPEPWIGNTTTPDPPGEYIWSPSIQGLILGAYFYGFVCTQLVGGRLAEVAGGKWPLGLSILFGSLLTFLTPIAADLGVAAIVLVRVAMGLIHGVCLPTAFAMFAHWAPVEERSTLLALCIMGDHVGTVLSMPLAGYLCENGFAGGWPSVFYVLGILGCIWFIFWCCLAYSKPADHPRISKGEIDYILKGQIQIGVYQKLPVPWKQILCSPPVWSIAIVTFCAAWGHTTLLTKLPTYLELVLHVPIQKNGVVNSLIYVCICITLFLSGFASDYLRSKKNFNPTTVRKGFQLIAMMGPAITTALIPVVGCDKNSVIALLTLAMAFLGFCGGGHVSIAVEMAPHYTATIFGLVSGIGCTAGIFSPLLAGLLLDNAHASIEQWRLVFYISSGFYMFGGIIFVLWASAERQSWAYRPTMPDLLKIHNTGKESDLFINKVDFERSFTYGTIG